MGKGDSLRRLPGALAGRGRGDPAPRPPSALAGRCSNGDAPRLIGAEPGLAGPLPGLRGEKLPATLSARRRAMSAEMEPMRRRIPSSAATSITVCPSFDFTRGSAPFSEPRRRRGR